LDGARQKFILLWRPLHAQVQIKLLEGLQNRLDC